MKWVFQFGRILTVCFLGETLAALLPLPIPASVYGLVLMLAALKLGVIRLEQVQDAGRFLVAILPVLFLPAAVGVMDLHAELTAMLLPCLLAVVPVTVLVMGAAGLVTQWVRRTQKGGAGHE